MIESYFLFAVHSSTINLSFYSQYVQFIFVSFPAGNNSCGHVLVYKIMILYAWQTDREGRGRGAAGSYQVELR